MTKKFLENVYTLTTPEETREMYDNWAASYDAEISENGYATPARVAEALARHMSDKSSPVLDFGCGTGLSGLALRAVGFDNIDGCDLSADMLAKATATGAYRQNLAGREWRRDRRWLSCHYSHRRNRGRSGTDRGV